jgi:hypothetical protein
MSNLIFPAAVRGLDCNATKTIQASTIVQKSPSGVATSIAQRKNPIWKWSLTYNYLKDNPLDIPAGLTYTDLKTLMGFIAARQGQGDDFLYDDPSDNSVGPALLTGGGPNLQAQLQVVNDGAGNYYSPVQRNLGGQFYEDITDLNGGIQVYDNGVAKASPADYTLLGPGLSIPGNSFAGLYLKWVAAPTGPVTAQFNFYFRVHFDMDERAFDQFMHSLWCLNGPEATNSSYLTFETWRPASA